MIPGSNERIRETLKNVRDKIKPIIEPLNLHLCILKMNIRLGTYADSISDELSVAFDVKIIPTNKFPYEQYSNNEWLFLGQGSTVEIAIDDLLADIDNRIPKWKKLLQQDKEAALLVGQRLLAIKEDTYYIKGNSFKVSINTEVDVIEHQPGRLLLEGNDMKFWIAIWKLTNTYYHTATKQNIPDHYYKLIQVEE
jgi:hypothetical protein